MSDRINSWRRLEAPWMGYISQFQAQNPTFRPLEYYAGSTVAGMTPQMNEALSQGWNTAQNMRATGNSLNQFGVANMRYGSPAQVTAAIGNQQRAAGRAAHGVRGAAGGVNSLNRTGLNRSMFNSIANNPALQGQIDAVSSDIMRNTTENVIPGIATSAVGAGNPYGTRTQHSYDTALRQTREAIGDVAAEMRFNNFNQARAATLQMQSQNQQAELARRGLAQQGYQAAGQLEMGANQFAANLRQQLGQQGVENRLAAMQMRGMGADRYTGVGQYFQDYRQAQLDDRVARHMFNQTAPFYTMPLYSNALAPPAGMPFRIGEGGATSSGPNLGFF